MKKKLFLLFIAILTITCVASPFTVLAASYQVPGSDQFTTEALELVNLDTDTVVYAKNADQRLEPASTTKIMTYIVVAEAIKDLEGTVITVDASVEEELLGTGSSMSGIITGEELTALQLLNCMMVPSGNDAALALAYYVSGGNVSKFIDKMNEKAKELGCTDTHFENPHGLHDDNHYTTAHDLALITKYAMGLPYFTEITSKTVYEIPATNKSAEPRMLYTTNLLLTSYSDYYYPYAQGIKTGSHDEAGYCLVSSAVLDGYTYLCVALHAPKVNVDGSEVDTNGAFVDSANLFRWAFTSLEMKTVVSKDDIIAEVPIQFAWNKDTVLLSAEKDYATILPNDVSVSSVVVTPELPEGVDAPVQKGDVIGTATLSYAGETLTTINLVAAESVERSELLHTTSTIMDVVSSPWFLIIAGIILVLVVIYIILAIMYNRKKKKLRKVKKYRKM